MKQRRVVRAAAVVHHHNLKARVRQPLQQRDQDTLRLIGRNQGDSL
jgi:hypothetical protein